MPVFAGNGRGGAESARPFLEKGDQKIELRRNGGTLVDARLNVGGGRRLLWVGSIESNPRCRLCRVRSAMIVLSGSPISPRVACPALSSAQTATAFRDTSHLVARYPAARLER